MSKDSEIKFVAKVKFNKEAAKEEIKATLHKAQMRLDQQVIIDSNYFCPLKTGTLQKSAQINTVLGSGLVIWKTPYASSQYYGVNFDRSKDPNPNATAKWFETAKAKKKSEWRKIVDATIKNC
ncbi:minor capsid protein [Treponema pectinovorum]|uniref:minor capsid protein n=1 Tax=Treponema pectinovorum TaxID=164 RepID=UPI0011CB041E|nr:minor capsid protein [Treponema pectinovorum]